MKQYLELLSDVYHRGIAHSDRTGVGRHSVFSAEKRFSLKEGFPLVTTRKMYPDTMITETVWFASGSIDVKDLLTSLSVLRGKEVNKTIWDQWLVSPDSIDIFIKKHQSAFTEFVESDNLESILTHVKTFLSLRFNQTIGPLYGAAWRNAPKEENNPLSPLTAFEDLPSDKVARWSKDYETSAKTIEQTLEQYCVNRYAETYDQLNEVLINLKKRPYSSRHVVSAWIPQWLPFEELTPQENILLGKGALAPCHAMFQFFVSPPKEEGGKKQLSLKLTIRSADTPVGTPYNIAQYSLLLAMVAHTTDMEANEFIFSPGDYHCYTDQKDLIPVQLAREPMTLPTLWLNPEVTDFFKFTPADIRIENYVSHPAIIYPVAT